MALYDGEGGGVAAVGSITGCGQGPSRGFAALDISADGCDEEVLRGASIVDDSLRCVNSSLASILCGGRLGSSVFPFFSTTSAP